MVKLILIVDDDPGVNHTVKYGLEGLDTDYKVLCAESGKECFEILENNQIPDLIILDILMPDMSGWEVQRKLRENIKWRNIPLIFFTAAADETSKKIGGITSDDYIEKPSSISELKQRIDKILKS